MRPFVTAAPWVIWLSITLGLILSIMPLPDWARPFRPEWTLLIILFWTLESPRQVAVGYAFLAGLCLDVMHGSLLGAHAAAMMVPVFLAYRLSRRTHQFPTWQLALLIVGLLTIYEFIQLWIDGTSGRPLTLHSRFLPIVSGGLIWPWLQLVLRDWRLRFRIT